MLNIYRQSETADMLPILIKSRQTIQIKCYRVLVEVELKIYAVMGNKQICCCCSVVWQLLGVSVRWTHCLGI